MPNSTRMSGKPSFGTLCAYCAGALVALVIFGIMTVKGLTAAGLTGTHGTLTVKECHKISRSNGQPSNDYGCSGSFRSDDGKVVDHKATIEYVDTEYDAGTKLSTQGHNGSIVLSILSAGTYTLASRGEVTEDFFLAFCAVLVIIPYLLFSWLTKSGETGGTNHKLRETWRATAGTRTRKIVVGTAAAALFGMIVVSPVLGLVLTTGS